MKAFTENENEYPMKVIWTVIIIFVSVGLCRSQGADTLRDKNHYYYLATFELKTVGKWILQDSIAPSVNYITFRCMDSLTSKQRKVRDYYFPVFIKIIGKADGALAEVIGARALLYAKSYPKELADRYACCVKTERCCKELEVFASYVGNEIMMADNHQMVYDSLLNAMTKNYKSWRDNKTLKVFIDKVNKVRSSW